MDAASAQGIEIDGKRGNERLALTCRHFGDATLVQHHAADQLHIEVHHIPGHRLVADRELHADHAACRILHHGKSLGENLVETLLQKFRILNL